ncbi:pectate lyase [Zalerion maritima]|uniref:Pectate lyase n=1 Tax=Zalerion maritima TaxID=339359 RepID=A0AAD5WUK2_9PEZI|nr:pectate lyase [Zalerion maritima]
MIHFHTPLVAALALAAFCSSATTNTELQTSFPQSSGTTELSAVQTIASGESFDGEMLQWDRNPSTCEEQAEGGDDDAVFILEEGATLSNVVIGPNNGEGVHCLGACTLNNVWWTDVCEDAATFKQESGTSYVLQHNGGGTVAVKNFYASDVGKVYRSCGNCDDQHARTSSFENIYVDGASVVAGVNGNEGDSTVIIDSCILDSDICYLFEGNDDGDEPSKTASTPDGSVCATSGVETSGC